MRVATARLLSSIDSHTEPRNPETELSILRAVNLSALAINGLVRTHLILTRGGWKLFPGLEVTDDSVHVAPIPAIPRPERLPPPDLFPYCFAG